MNTGSSFVSAPTPATIPPTIASAYPNGKPGRLPRLFINRANTCDMNAVPVVTVAVAMPPHGVDCPRMRCTTNAPTVTADDRAAAAAN